jgi:hypothetical protein
MRLGRSIAALVCARERQRGGRSKAQARFLFVKTITSTLVAFAFGSLAVTAFAQQATTETTTAVAPAVTAPASKDVGISSRDGVTVSGTDTLVTRNGVTEKLSRELKLDNGMRVNSDGTVVTAEGGTFQLRPSQVLTFEGKLLNAPVTDTAAPTTTTSERTTTVATKTTEPTPAETEASTKAAAEISASEAERRAKAAAAGAASNENAPK